ncbi:DpnII family type II restriction endonuclease [Mesoplasma lactucae]|nr:DpnII family type II restriction endonuclease [Mesoplasma lactucae]ATZ20397.1 type II restriction enzyme [Mesoplasma lactucae ATCC 49193]MCL8216568.1 Type-2 restriction enzyme MboI [Mesoplasma lactucae ATCC 49193]
MKKDFNEFIQTLQPGIMTYEDLVDVDKVISNYEKWSFEFDEVNKIIGDKENFYKNLNKVLNDNPSIKQYVPLLFATRNEQKKMLGKDYELIQFNNKTPNEEVIEVIKNSPLDELVGKGYVKNINDYLIGVEVGLDTNARKNRTGKVMETKVAELLADKGLDVTLQYNSKNLLINHLISEEDILKIFPDGSADKVFDFMFEYDGEIYLGETNFYSSGGSKLNEVAKSYILLDERINNVKGFHFVWITDGVGWKSAKNQIEEAYGDIEYIYNLDELKNHTVKELFSK